MPISNTQPDMTGDMHWEKVDSGGRRIVVGDVAHDSPVGTDAPVKLGAVYVVTRAAVADGDVARLLSDSVGALCVVDDGLREFEALASGARTATTNSGDLTNPGAKGALIMVDVTAFAATPDVDLSIQAKDPSSGSYVTLCTATASITDVTGVDMYVYLIRPGDLVVPGAGTEILEMWELPLPRTWRILMTHNDADSLTYSIGVSYLV